MGQLDYTFANLERDLEFTLEPDETDKQGNLYAEREAYDHAEANRPLLCGETETSSDPPF